MLLTMYTRHLVQQLKRYRPLSADPSVVYLEDIVHQKIFVPLLKSIGIGAFALVLERVIESCNHLFYRSPGLSTSLRKGLLCVSTEVDPIAMKYGHGAVVVSGNSANGRGFIIHSSHNYVLLKGLSNQILDILFYGADTCDSKVIDEYFSHIGREEGRQRGAEMDVLHPKAQQT